MTAQYVKGKGMMVTFVGLTVLLPEYWSVQVIARHLHEVMELLEPQPDQ